MRQTKGISLLFIAKCMLLPLCAVSSTFYRVLPPFSTFCFSEDIPKHTLVKISLSTDSIQSHFVLSAYFDNSVLVSGEIRKQSPLDRKFTTQRHGNHRFCVSTQAATPQKIKITLQIGKHASDFGSLAGHDIHLSTLASQSRLAQEFLSEIIAQNAQGRSIIIAEERDGYKFGCLYAVSTVFVSVSLALIWGQYKLIKKHLHGRKYI